MSRTRVMVVEDDLIVSLEIVERLKSMNYDPCDVAVTGREAIEKAATSRPDLVLMDIHLKGGMDGIQAAGEIRSALGIPVIYLTAYADESTLQRAKRTDPFGYLIKPLSEKELYTAIEMALYRAKMENQLREKEEWLTTTLNSIHDAVITTDPNGKITFMNPTAAHMTGWDRQDADHQPLSHVFRVVDEKSEKPLENPVAQLLKSKKSMEPTDHALLIAKDGRKIPVENSGAPIQGVHGDVSGVVLISRDISERKEAEKAMRSMNERLQKLDKVKTDFLSTVSHELRTPIAIMREGVTLVLEGLAGKTTKAQRGLLKDTLDNIDRLSRLVADLLDLSRIEVGKMKLRKAPVDVSTIAETAYRHFQQQALDKEIRLYLSVPAGCVIYADADKVMQIFNNLISNALRYTEKDGDIRIEVTSSKGTVLCSVKDTGIGISRENIPRLFSKFEQFGRVDGPGYKGTGLGLAISKNLVEKHGGRIGVKSEIGRGSHFWFTLRKVSFPSILIVDDDSQITDLVRFSMEREYRFLIASTGEEALRLAESRKPSLIVLDMKLPGMSGYEVIGRLKQNANTCEIPIMIISAYSVDMEKIEDMSGHSALPVFDKPFRPDRLAGKIKEMLEE